MKRARIVILLAVVTLVALFGITSFSFADEITEETSAIETEASVSAEENNQPDSGLSDSAQSDEEASLADSSVDSETSTTEKVADQQTVSTSVSFMWLSLDGGNIGEGDSAVFLISGRFVEGNEVRVEITGDYNEYPIEGFLSGEQYTVVQEKAPFGHAAIADPFSFTVTAEYESEPPSIVVSGLDEEHYEASWGTLLLRNKGLPNDYEPLSICIKKVDENGAPLAGAKFSLSGFFVAGVSTTQAQGNILGYDEKAATTNNQGEVVFSDLLDMNEAIESDTEYKYVLVEKSAPEGFQPIEAEPIVQINNGTIQIIGNNAPHWASSNGGSGQVGEDQMAQIAVSEDGKTITVINKKKESSSSSKAASSSEKQNKASTSTTNKKAANPTPTSSATVTAKTSDGISPLKVAVFAMVALALLLIARKKTQAAE